MVLSSFRVIIKISFLHGRRTRVTQYLYFNQTDLTQIRKWLSINNVGWNDEIIYLLLVTDEQHRVHRIISVDVPSARSFDLIHKQWSRGSYQETERSGMPAEVSRYLRNATNWVSYGRSERTIARRPRNSCPVARFLTYACQGWATGHTRKPNVRDQRYRSRLCTSLYARLQFDAEKYASVQKETGEPSVHPG